MTLPFILDIAGFLGILFGLRCYRELWKWAKQCQRAEIVIARNRRVQLRAPLVEWLTWANQLDHDESANGRTIYRNEKITVSIIRPKGKKTATTVKAVRHSRRTRKEQVPA